ncbi:polysaccharide biosynthesis protein [Aeromicrobium phragmitis]|uniref:Polysaccharide biosynthesis protein n=1 Tax=Aeromicrobium phragmitis TaxID=2478914 RepID=A0A3L8PQ44_9ACTN|nr:polysaccharide biosynthesis protein [Aeromicrobium phragmitis]
MLAAFAPMLILPVITRVAPEGWASFAAGQSVGLIGMIVMMFGWSIAGPVRIARAADQDERAHILAESFYTRAIAAAIVLPLAAIIAAAVASPAYRFDAVAIALASALGGFSPSWFCIGAGQPAKLTLYDVLPKLLAAAGAVVLVLLTGQITWYAVLLALFCIVAYAAHARREMRGHHTGRLSVGEVRHALRAQLPTAAIDTVSNSYGATPVPIASAGLPVADANPFASADRVYRLGLLAVVAFGNAFQGWVLERDATDRPARHRLAIISHVTLGVAGGLGIAILGPWATAIAFGQDVKATPIACLLFGLAFVCISSTTPFIRNVLVPHGRFRLVLAVTCVSALAGLTVMISGAASGSATVIAIGVLTSEVITMTALIIPAARLLRREAATPTSPS